MGPELRSFRTDLEVPNRPSDPQWGFVREDAVKIRRRFTREGEGPYAGIPFDRRVSEIRNPDGSIVFRLEDVEVPAEWSQLATDIVVSKYFRKAGLKEKPGHETSVRQVVQRIAHTIRVWGQQQGG